RAASEYAIHAPRFGPSSEQESDVASVSSAANAVVSSPVIAFTAKAQLPARRMGGTKAMMRVLGARRRTSKKERTIVTPPANVARKRANGTGSACADPRKGIAITTVQRKFV